MGGGTQQLQGKENDWLREIKVNNKLDQTLLYINYYLVPAMFKVLKFFFSPLLNLK